MPIYDQSFRHYDGPRNTARLWWPVAWYTLRPAFKMKFAWLILLMILGYLLMVSIGFFAASKMVELAPEQAESAARTARLQRIPIFGRGIDMGTLFYGLLQPMVRLLWLLILAVGAGVISSDRRNAALPLFFSRPLTPFQYSAGKVLGVALMPLGILALFCLLVYVQFVSYFDEPMALITQLPTFGISLFCCAILAGFISLAMVAFSSMAKTARIAGVLYLAFFAVLRGLCEYLAGSSNSDQLLALSPTHSMDRIAYTLLRPNLEEMSSSIEFGNLQTGPAAISLILYAALFVFIIHRNLKVVEVVK